jgi:hypothetical protein
MTATAGAFDAISAGPGEVDRSPFGHFIDGQGGFRSRVARWPFIDPATAAEVATTHLEELTQIKSVRMETGGRSCLRRFADMDETKAMSRPRNSAGSDT